MFTETEIKEISGYVGNFETTFANNGKEVKLNFGNIIVATGLKPFDASKITNYLYGVNPDVVTALEFEEMLLKGKILKKDGSQPQNIAIIHCVGSRNKDYLEYCSRTCCLTALKFANQLRSALPEANIYDLYADMRVMGKGCEELYTETSKKGIMFLMFDQKDGMPVIKQSKGKDYSMLIELKELLSGQMVEVPADMVILMTGREAHETAKEVSHAVGISVCSNNFYIEKHPKLDPVATTTDGVFIVGTCQGPKDIPDTISQARAAASRILGTILKGSVKVEVTTAHLNEDICCGCQTCIKVCPYTAITYDSEKKVSVVNEILCKGCGTCGAACPTGAIKCKHFTDEQIFSQIEGLMTV